MCVACRQMRPKKELVRAVRTPDGMVLIDESGRANGRGAYLCREMACFDKAVKIHALDRALATKIDTDTMRSFEEFFSHANGQQTT